VAWLITKYLVTAAVVVLVSEAAKRSDRLGGLLGALPMVTILALVWLYVEHQSPQKIANHAWYTFWYVLPTLPMFLVIPLLLRHGVGFWPSLVAGCALTVLLYLVTAWSLAKFGVTL
jgi:hypothetical protein